MMDRRAFITIVGGSILAAPLVADGQAKNPPIGFLATGSAEYVKSRVTAFEQALHKLGYVDGTSITIEYRYADGRFEQLPSLATELVRLRVDILVVMGAPAAHAAKNATSVIPIVIGNAADPVGTGLVASLARPGGNITGLSDFNLGVVTKRLELLKEIVPSASRVAVLLNPANPTNPLQLQEIQAAAPALGVTLLAFEAKAADDIDRAFTAIHKEHVEASVVMGDPLFGIHRRRIVELVAQSQLPAIYDTRVHVDVGGLISYG